MEFRATGEVGFTEPAALEYDRNGAVSDEIEYQGSRLVQQIYTRADERGVTVGDVNVDSEELRRADGTLIRVRLTARAEVVK